MGSNLGLPAQPQPQAAGLQPPGFTGPRQEPMALNSPTPQMLNMARGQDPNANGFGDIRQNIDGKTRQAPQNPDPNQVTGGREGNIQQMIAQLLMRRGK